MLDTEGRGTDLPSKEFYLNHGIVKVINAMDCDKLLIAYWSLSKPLFHAMVTLHVPRSFPDFSALLLKHGADPKVRATVRKPTVDKDSEWGTWENVTAVEYAKNFIYQDLVNQDAVQLVQEAS